MKKIKSIFNICCGAILLITACEPEIPITGTANPNLSIYDLRNIYKEGPVTLSKENMKQATSITGVVISDPDNSNHPSGKVVLQGYKGKNVNGIVLDLGNEAQNYKFGDSITVKVEGLKLDRVNNVLEVSNITSSMIEKISSGKRPIISASFSSIADLKTNVDKYESTLIGINSLFVVNPTVGKKYADNLILTDWVEELEIPVSSQAAFANEEVYNLANYVFLLLKNTNGQPKVLLQNTNAVKELELEEHKPGELYEGFPEDFTDKLGTSSNLNFEAIFPTSKLPWKFKGAYTLTSGNFTHTNGGASGDRLGAMMTGGADSFIELNKNLYYGASKVGVYLYPATSTDAGSGKLPIVARIEYSQDSGNTWKQVGDDINITANRRYIETPIDVDISGIVRFRVYLVSTAGGRLGVDYFRVYQK